MKVKLSTMAAASVALILGAGTAFAQDAYADWDTDSNNGINQTEWDTGWGQNGVFDRFDADNDDVLSNDELNTGLAGQSTGATSAGDASRLDTRFGENAYTEWDADDDGNLTEDEFNNGVFAGYDKDGSGVIEEPEFGDVGDDMGDGGFWDV